MSLAQRDGDGVFSLQNSPSMRNAPSAKRLSVMWYYNGKEEIDFVAIKDGKQYFIQVAYSVAEEKAYDRELRAFNHLDNSCQKILITNDDLDYSTSTVKHLKLSEFLKMESL